MQITNRVIPVLTISNNKLVKTIRFKNPNYIGDPVNAVKIFNDKRVDEIVLLDITATLQSKEPNYRKIEEVCSEAFMPFAYGGGITSLDQIEKLFLLGIEKVILNSVLANDLKLIERAAAKFGSQSIVASVDVKKPRFRNAYKAYSRSGKRMIKQDLMDYLSQIQSAGAGEVFLNSIDRDGTYAGFDLDLISEVSKLLEVPLIACGGAGSHRDLKMGIEAGASAVAASSIFVYSGQGKGVLISYLSE